MIWFFVNSGLLVGFDYVNTEEEFVLSLYLLMFELKFFWPKGGRTYDEEGNFE